MYHYLILPCLAGFVTMTILLSTPAFGQDEAPETPPVEASETPADTDNLLGGPSVDETPQTDQSGMSGARRNRNQRNRIDLRTWIETLRQVDLSKEQEVSLRKIISEYQSKMRTYQDEHGSTVRKLAEELRALEKNEQVDPERQNELRQELQKERQHAPKVEPYQEQAMELLTDGQIEIFRADLAEIVAEQQARRNRRRTQRSSGDSQSMSDSMYDSTMTEQSDQMQDTARDPRQRSSEQGNDVRNRIDERAQRALRFLRAHQSEQAKNSDAPAGQSDDRRGRSTR